MRTIKLSEIFRVGSSKRVLKADWKDSGVPFYRGREITRLSKTGVADNELYISEEHFEILSRDYGVPVAGDIMVTAIGTIGNTYIVKEEDRFYFKDASVLWLHKIDEVHTRFIDYWLKSELFFEQLDRGNGATVDTLTIEKLSNVTLTLPSIDRQLKIVQKLDSAFDEIDSLEENLDQIEEKRNQLLGSLLSISFTKTSIPIIPLGSVAEVIAGQSPEGTYYNASADGMAFYQGKKEFTEKFIGPPTTWTTKITKVAKPDDILMSVRAPVGPVNFTQSQICIGRGLAAIRAGQNIDKNYLYYFLLHKQPEISGNTGAVFDSINKDQIAAIEVPVPPIGTQLATVANLNVVLHELNLLRDKTIARKHSASALRKSLLSGALMDIEEVA